MNPLRFLSPHQAYKIILRHEVIEPLPSGAWKQIARGLMAEFRHGDVTDWERAYGRERFQTELRRGAPTELDGATPADTSGRLSSFDTVIEQKLCGWSDEVREWVEQQLLANHAHGREFERVEKPLLPPPWPTYDQMRGRGHRSTPELIAARVRELGIPAVDVLAYEQQGANRPDVVAALEALLPTVEEESDRPVEVTA